MIDRRIEDRLRALGLTCVYEGYFCLVHAIRLAEENPQRLTLPSKWLYPDVARHCGMAVNQVDSALRAAIRRCCRTAPEEVAVLCGGNDNPTVVGFIAGLAHTLHDGSDR